MVAGDVAVRKNRQGDEEGIRVNGLGRGYSIAIIALQAVIGGAALAALLSATSIVIEMREFMSRKDRFTIADGKELGAQIQKLEIDMQAHAQSLDVLVETVEERRPPQWLLRQIEHISKEDTRLSEQDKRLQQQIDRIEEEVFFGKRKPSLKPYAPE